jgi:SMI1-KNR4 cell-wall
MYEWLPEAIEQSEPVFQEFSVNLEFKLYQPTTKEKIKQCEQLLGLSLPRSYREFLLKHNGAHLFCSDTAAYAETEIWWSNSGIVVFGIEALLSHRQHLQWIYELSDSLETPFPVPIAYLGRICTGDFCALEMGELTNFENPVMYCQQDCDPSDWKESIVASSFEDWLQKMFTNVIKWGRSPEYWLKDNLYNNSIAQLSEE